LRLAGCGCGWQESCRGDEQAAVEVADAFPG